MFVLSHKPDTIISGPKPERAFFYDSSVIFWDRIVSNVVSDKCRIECIVSAYILQSFRLAIHTLA